MNCFGFRQSVLEDPYHLSSEASEHKNECVHCARYHAEIEQLDNNIRDAFTVPVPEGIAARVLLNQSLQDNPRKPARWYWVGVAASFLVALILVFQIPGEPLEADILTHLEHEAHQVHGKAGSIDNDRVQQVLGAVGSNLVHQLGNVTYASTCVIDDKLVAHLVVEYEQQTYTLLVLPVTPNGNRPFADTRWIGVIDDTAVGTFAVITESQATSSDSLKAAYAHFDASIGMLALAP